MLIVSKGLSDSVLQQPIIAAFERAGISRDRLSLGEHALMQAYFATHHEIDLLLDTFPVNGHTTTCHALWMGVPVVCLEGFASFQRFAASVMHNIGLADFVASDAQAYVEIAIRMAGDLTRLAELRATMRARMTNSTLLDAKRFARNVEAAYRSVWLK